VTTASRTTTSPVGADVNAPVAHLVHWLETGEVTDGMFAPGCFTDVTVPHWRVQARTSDEIVALRRELHPFPGRVRIERVDRTGSGFVIAFEERWPHEGQHWYCRELIRADVVDGAITDLAVYCTGDWDEEVQRRHAAEVTLHRP
jgi:hypothetical protein